MTGPASAAAGLVTTSARWHHRPIVLARPLVVLVLAALVAGCGGGATPSTTTGATPPSAQRPPADPLRPPSSVPQKATGTADAASVKVIRAWANALRRGQVKQAARYFSLPSKFQNGTPVLTIDIPPERVAINEALACGAVPIRAGGAGAFTIVTFRLVERVGGDCGSGTGATARSAIRVADGKIREWYRLPDAPAPTTPEPSDPAV